MEPVSESASRETSAVAPANRLAAWLAFVGALAAIAYAGRVAGGEPDEDVLYRYSTAAGAVVQYALMLAIVLWIAKGLPKRRLLALRRPVSWPRAAGLGVAALVVVYLVSGVFAQFSDPGAEQGLAPDAWEPSRAGAFAANFVVVATLGPIVEELVYRGEGFTLLERHGTWVATLGTGLLFGLAHGLVVGLPILTLFGVALALVRLRTDSVYPPIVLHALFNAIALIAAVTVET